MSSSPRQEFYYASLLFFFIVVVFFWPQTLLGHLLATTDEFFYSGPLRQWAFEQVRQGHLPLWNPYVLSGYPIVSQAALGLFFPLNWLLSFSSAPWAVNFILIAPYFLGLCFTYGFARALGLTSYGACLSALCFIFSGFMTSHFSITACMSQSAIWLPLVLWAVDRSYSRPLGAVAVWGAVALCLAILGGHGQTFTYLVLTVFLYVMLGSLLQIYSSGKISWQALRPLIVVAALCPLAVGLAAVQVLPSMEAARLSVRTTLPFTAFATDSVPFKEFIFCLLYPLPPARFEGSIYFHDLSLLLAGVAIVAAMRGRGSPAIRRQTLIWTVIALVAFLLCLGANTPLYQLLYQVPLYNKFRGPHRNGYELAFALAMLAGVGASYLESTGRKRLGAPLPPQLTVYLGSTVLAAVASFGVLIGVLRWYENDVLLTAFRLMVVVAVSGVLVLLPWLSFRVQKLWLGLVCLVFLVLPAIFMYHSKFLGAMPVEEFLAKTPVTWQWFHTQVNNQQERVLSYGIFTDNGAALIGAHNVAMLIPISSASGWEVLISERYSRILGDFDGERILPHAQVFAPDYQGLNLLNVRYVAAVSGDKKLQMAFPDQGRSMTFVFPSISVSSLSVVSTLGNAAHVPDNQPVMKFTVRSEEGEQVVRFLRVGRDTAEWAWDRADVRSMVKHRRAEIAESFPVSDSLGNFDGHRYRGNIDFGRALKVREIQIEYIGTGETLYIYQMTLHDGEGITHPVDVSAVLGDERRWQRVFADQGVEIFKNLHSLPRAWLVPEVRSLTLEEVLAAITTGRLPDGSLFDPRRTALVENGLEYQWENFDWQAQVEIVGSSPNTVELIAQSASPGFLVLSEAHFPGWRAYVDGERVAVRRVNYVLRGVPLPAGSHRIRFVYSPASVKVGALVSAVTFLVVVAFLVRARRRRL